MVVLSGDTFQIGTVINNADSTGGEPSWRTFELGVATFLLHLPGIRRHHDSLSNTTHFGENDEDDNPSRQ